jgi:hypothetical protein
MTSAKKLLITTESHEVFTLRISNTRGAAGFCELCNAEVEMLSFEQAVMLTGIHTRDLVRLVDGSEIHAIETRSGHYLVCKDSAMTYLVERLVRKDK